MEHISKAVRYLQTSLQSRIKPDMSSPPSTSSGCVSGVSEEENSDVMERSVDLSGSVSAETYLPEEVLSLSSVQELESAISHCKAMVLERPNESDEKKWLVRRLIELRLRLEDIKEINEVGNTNESNRILLGHHFVLQNFPTSTAKHYCDRCSGIIWNVIHSWYLCTDCDYKCHVRCLNQVCRICAHLLVTEKPVYITELCPETANGLCDQNYRCAECLTHTSFRDGVLEPRLCDYNGKYYCPTCHWNSTSIIPARVVHNWDFREKKVCRSSKQILKLMSKLPIIKLEELNPVLFASIDELKEVKVLRQQLLLIKKYLTSCKAALESHLLWQLGDRLHFIESEENYSLQDLLDLRSGELVQYLGKLQTSFVKHIKEDCKVCYGRGYCCELCSEVQVIFPFESNVISCTQCQSTFHFPCWVKANGQCPKCYRIQQRLSELQITGSSDNCNSFPGDS